MLPSLQKIKFADKNLVRLQTNVDKATRPALQVPFLDGVLIENVSLGSSAPTNVQHGLGRAIVGWLVVDKTSAAEVYRAPQGSLPISMLPLQASASTTVAVWVF